MWLIKDHLTLLYTSVAVIIAFVDVDAVVVAVVALVVDVVVNVVVMALFIVTDHIMFICGQ